MSMADVSTIISARRCIVNRYFLTYLPYFCIIYLSILLSISSFERKRQKAFIYRLSGVFSV